MNIKTSGSYEAQPRFAYYTHVIYFSYAWIAVILFVSLIWIPVLKLLNEAKKEIVDKFVIFQMSFII